MFRRIAFGATAIAVSLGGLALTASPVSAKTIKPDAAHVHCTALTGSATFIPALVATPVAHGAISFFATATGCTLTTPAVGSTAGTITHITIGGTAKTKNASTTSLASPDPNAPPTSIKATVTFLDAANGAVCVNKAKLGTGTPTYTSIGGGDLAVHFPTSSSAPGGKGLGGKCFKGKNITIPAILDTSFLQLAALTSIGTLNFSGVHGATTLDIG